MDLDQQTLQTTYNGRSKEARHEMELPTPPKLDSVSLSRERKKKPVNLFVQTFHELGPLHIWKACFAARYRGNIVGVVVLKRPASRAVDDGNTLSIARFCTRPDRPANLGSWLIAKARKWAVLEGYDQLIAYAGVAGNRGVVYSAAGFECLNDNDPATGGGDGWTNRSGRSSLKSYEKRKWTCELTEDYV